MNTFFSKLVRTKEGKKFLVFIVLIVGFIGSVVFGANTFSSEGFSSYVQSVTPLQERLCSAAGAIDAVMYEALCGKVPQVASDKEGNMAVVKRVVDGDTIELESGEKVRYIGVNTPESVKVNSPVECFGKEASAHNKSMVEGKTVRLEKDVSDKDRYGRLLRFVYLSDGTFVNEALVRDGYARVSTFPPDVTRAEDFKLAERDARDNKRGLWADDTCAGKK